MNSGDNAAYGGEVKGSTEPFVGTDSMQLLAEFMNNKFCTGRNGIQVETMGAPPNGRSIPGEALNDSWSFDGFMSRRFGLSFVGRER